MHDLSDDASRRGLLDTKNVAVRLFLPGEEFDWTRAYRLFVLVPMPNAGWEERCERNRKGISNPLPRSCLMNQVLKALS